MPGQFTDKNGGNMAGHSDKWSNDNRRKNSHDAGQGSRGSRNQGTGEAGKANTVASAGIDTSRMNPHEKLKYFNSLGLLNPTQKQQLADMDAASAPKSEPKPVQAEPKAAPASPSTNPVKELSDRLMKVFAQKPNLIQGIVKSLQAVPKEQMKDTAQRVLDSMKGNASTDANEVFQTVMNAIENAPSDDLDFDEVESSEEEPARHRSGKMSEKEFREVNAYLGKDFVDSIIKQVKQFKDFESALFNVDMAIENVQDVNDVMAVRSSMASAADDLGSSFEMVDSTEETEDDSTEPEEGSIDWIRKINKFAFDQNAQNKFDSYNSYRDLLKNNKDSRLFQFYLENLEKNPKTKPLYDLAMHKLNDFDPENGEDSSFINIGDAVFSVIKDGEDVQQSSGSDSSTESGSKGLDVSNLSPTAKHMYENAKEAFNEPDLESGLAKYRSSRDFSDDLKGILDEFAHGMKMEGVKPAMINKTLNHYMNQVKGNYFKFLKAKNAMIDNSDAYDPEDEDTSENSHNMLSFESALEDYDRGDITSHEKGFIEMYKQLHGE